MTTEGQKGWRDAILSVLRDAEEPLSYNDITTQIEVRRLRTLTGNTPAATVNSVLNSLAKTEGSTVVAMGGGMYALPEIAERFEAKAAEEEAAELAAAADPDRFTLKAYGLYWDRSKVNWEPTPNSERAQLIGSRGRVEVNFADQDGVYLLHHGNEIVYAGQTYTPNTEGGGLYGRLRYHHTSNRKSDRWDTFSWFGFRPIGSDRKLLSTPGKAAAKDVIDLLEGIFIEGLMPRLNMRRGEGSKAWEAILFEQS